jgi:nucleoside-triphosphatase THEP1
VQNWLENSDERLFILTGEPGSGKSMVAAWLADPHAPVLEIAEDSQRLERIRSQVKAAHFYLAASGNTSPKALARSLAGQLQVNVQRFDQSLAETLKEHIHLLSQQEVGLVAQGASVIGIKIESLNLGGLGMS